MAVVVSKHLLLTVPLVLTAGLAVAAEARLTPAAAARRVLERFPAVAAARARAEEARGAHGEAVAATRPTLRLSLAGTRYDEPMVVSPIHGFGAGLLPPFDRTLLQGSATAAYTLFDGGGRGARVRAADERAEAATAAGEASTEAVLAKMLSTYLDALGQAEVLAAHERRLEALRAERTRAVQLRDVGRAPDLEVLRAEASLAAAEAERTRIAAQLDRAERDLAALTGTTPEETRAARLSPVRARDADPGTRESLVAAARAASPALGEARRLQASAEAAVSAARALRWPEVRAAASVLAFDGPSSPTSTEWNAGLQVSVPVFTGGATARGIERAEAGARAAAAQERLLALDVGQQVERALASLEEARARADSLERAVARLGEVARIQRLLLENGKGTQTDYLAAEGELLAAQASLSLARYGQAAARVELARASGRLDVPWIEENLGVVE